MKNVLVLLGCFYIFPFTNAQSYQFSQTNSTYTDLTGGTSLNGTSVWSSFQSFAVPIGFSFEFMGNNYSTIYIEGSGFCRFDANYYYLINPFTVALEDKGTSVSLSPLSYRLDGVSPARILKIEWENCGFVNDASGTANFQLWLHEGTNVIEVHTGNCNATAGAYSGNANPGPAMGIYRFSSVSFCVYGIGLTGTPSSVTDTEIINSNCDLFDYSLNGTPASGNVYRFEPGSLSIENEKSENKIKVYPNPAENSLHIEIENFSVQKFGYEIMSYTGQKVTSGSSGCNHEIDISDLSPGSYFLILNWEEGSSVITKFVKE